MRTATLLPAALAVLALALTGCGAIVESATERVTGQLLSDEDTDVEVDVSDGGVSVSGDDGDVDIDLGDDGLVITGDDGEQSELRIDGESGEASISAEDGEFEMRAGGELPEDFPDAFPVPDGAEVVQQQSMRSDADGRELVVVLAVPEEFDAVADPLEAGLVDAGFEIDEGEGAEIAADGERVRLLAFAGHGVDEGMASIVDGDDDGVLVHVGLRSDP